MLQVGASEAVHEDATQVRLRRFSRPNLANDEHLWLYELPSARALRSRYDDAECLRTFGHQVLALPHMGCASRGEYELERTCLPGSLRLCEPLLNLAPKKINWDLKRDLEPQMKKLRSMTGQSELHLSITHADMRSGTLHAAQVQPDGFTAEAALICRVSCQC
eukprot:6177960-Pleurochrysis_carterae.AAC.1